MNWTAIGSSGVPFLRLAFAGSFLVGSIGLISHRSSAPASNGVYELVLHADQAPKKQYLEYFGSRFNSEGGPVLVNHDGSDGKRLEFTQRFPYIDGCWWESTETLEPISATQYRYYYSDRQVECDTDLDVDDEHQIETVSSVRTGLVDVVAVK